MLGAFALVHRCDGAFTLNCDPLAKSASCRRSSLGSPDEGSTVAPRYGFFAGLPHQPVRVIGSPTLALSRAQPMRSRLNVEPSSATHWSALSQFLRRS